MTVENSRRIEVADEGVVRPIARHTGVHSAANFFGGLPEDRGRVTTVLLYRILQFIVVCRWNKSTTGMGSE